MKRSIWRTACPLFLFLALSISSVFADESAREKAITAAGEEIATTGPLITDTTIPQTTGTALLYVPLFLEFTAGNFKSDWHRTGAGGDFSLLNAQAQLFYGLADRTEIYLAVPYTHKWASDVNKPGSGGETSADYGGLGDVNLAFKYLLVKEKNEFPAVSCLFLTGFSTGHHNRLNPRLLGTDMIGNGAFTFTFGFNLYKLVSSVKLYGNLWYTMSTDAKVNEKPIRPRDTATFNFAAEYPLGKQWIVLGELLSKWDTERLIGRRSGQPGQALMSILPGIEYIASEKWNFAAGVKIDLFGKNTVYKYTPVLASFYSF
jgi:hypothetical protein